MIIKMGRKLVTIQKIHSLTEIPEKDLIETGKVNDWNVIVKQREEKGDDPYFKNGDLCVFFEIDSVLPDKPEFEFLRSKKFRIKTMKMSGMISEGLVLPLSILPKSVKIKEGLDVTEILGVTKFEKYIPAQNKIQKPVTFKDFIKQKLGINQKFPKWIKKTDEERIQNCFNRLQHKKDLVVSEKLDGCSATYAIKQHKFLFLKFYSYYICSRTQVREAKKDNVWGEVFINYKMKEKLKRLFKELKPKNSLVVQGEIIGEGIQGNKYKKTSFPEFYAFNLVVDRVAIYPYEVLKKAGIPLVPCINPKNSILEETQATVEDILGSSEGKSKINEKTEREGLVWRHYTRDDTGKLVQDQSFKSISRKFLMMHDE